MEIATTDNPIKDKYGIEYNQDEMPFVCFATVNFYNEINNPQHRGMFKFFDNSFIGKPINTNFINSMSNLNRFTVKMKITYWILLPGLKGKLFGIIGFLPGDQFHYQVRLKLFPKFYHSVIPWQQIGFPSN